MKDELFDKELSELYQQRKQHLTPPNVDIAQPPKNKRYSPLNLLSILTIAGFASFGIMALITHFALIPDKKTRMPNNTSYRINITDEDSIRIDDKQTPIAVKPKLPPKPIKNSINSEVKLLVPTKNNAQLNEIESMHINAVQIVKLPQLTEPELNIKPIFKIMPKFSNKALFNKSSGTVRLQYEIDNSGSVKNIEIVSSSVSPSLQRSAKKALAKWKYKPDENVQNNYEIIFEFNTSQ